jgi:hypothetical protein
MAGHHNSVSQLLWRPQSRTQSMPVRRLGAGPKHLTCERAYSGYEIVAALVNKYNTEYKIEIYE